MNKRIRKKWRKQRLAAFLSQYLTGFPWASNFPSSLRFSAKHNIMDGWLLGKKLQEIDPKREYFPLIIDLGRFENSNTFIIGKRGIGKKLRAYEDSEKREPKME